MNLSAIECLAVFFVSLLLAGIIIPQILLISFRKNLFDEIDERKIHQGRVPRLGGIAFMPSMVFSVACVGGLCCFAGLQDASMPEETFVAFCFGVCALMIMYLVGMADDLIGVRYSAKFVAQILAAGFLSVSGLTIDNLYGFCGIYEIPLYVAVPFTMLVVVFVTNSINLIDGIDGLASGLSSIAMLFYGWVLLCCGETAYALVAFGLLGALIQFYYYNVFGNAKVGKKIFMGDTGALTTGIIICFLGLHICNLDVAAHGFDCDPLVMAFAPLLIPCFDVVRVYFRRIRHHTNPFLPDKSHIHHKLLAAGLRQRVAMVSILLVSLVFIAANYWLSIMMNSTFLLGVDVLVFVVINIWLGQAIKQAETRINIDTK
ncbi:MAG: undecaprenyl/decaprenyl-phosphate alpha-N-acetylglucosaminyl 1-phosphate transferase [Muribaculaceae bacterium]|nr:undecaprenyl/decaprenyl-phosphate alpha-N-acetylglucosaminyl 1-phosphate transferase [Muribaculaceae bacterium]